MSSLCASTIGRNCKDDSDHPECSLQALTDVCAKSCLAEINVMSHTNRTDTCRPLTEIYVICQNTLNKRVCLCEICWGKSAACIHGHDRRVCDVTFQTSLIGAGAMSWL
eukprot:802495-Rhodomonas_salina.1